MRMWAMRVHAVALSIVASKSFASLAALIRVHDVWRAKADQGFVQGIDTELRFQGIGQAPGQDLARCPVHNNNQVQKPKRPLA